MNVYLLLIEPRKTFITCLWGHLGTDLFQAFQATLMFYGNLGPVKGAKAQRPD